MLDPNSAPTTAELLAALEADTTFEAGAPFLKIAADYFQRTRIGEGPVSTQHDKRTLAARFDEPIPMGMKPLEEVVRRLETDVMPDVNQLMHPGYMGHQVSAPLAAAVWTEVVSGRKPAKDVGSGHPSRGGWRKDPLENVQYRRPNPVVRHCHAFLVEQRRQLTLVAETRICQLASA